MVLTLLFLLAIISGVGTGWFLCRYRMQPELAHKNKALASCKKQLAERQKEIFQLRADLIKALRDLVKEQTSHDETAIRLGLQANALDRETAELDAMAAQVETACGRLAAVNAAMAQPAEAASAQGLLSEMG
jgi:hypothetical protein